VAQQRNVPSQVLQGIVVPNAQVDPVEFFRRTRRLTFTASAGQAWNGFGTTNLVQIPQTGIIAGIYVRIFGALTVTLGGGTCATTGRWPYDLVRRFRIAANGQSNLINCSGWKIKARDAMSNVEVGDKGVSQSISGATVTSGSLSQASESWGVGQLQTGIAGAPTVYNVDLMYYLPLAHDQLTLLGAIFAQTASTDLSLALDWANSSELFTLTGAATAVPALTVQVEPVVFTIPEVNGQIIVPDLSVFHSLIETRFPLAATGDNEIKLAGQGVGRQLMRLFWQTWNGTPTAPLALTDANYGQVLWRFGGNDTPEQYMSARLNRFNSERIFNVDIGGPQGFGCFDFCVESAFRDSVDEGAATELRFLVNIAGGVALANSPAVEYVQETIFAGASGG
jgi:hypothetical protein